MAEIVDLQREPAPLALDAHAVRAHARSAARQQRADDLQQLEAPVVGDVGGCLLGVDPVWRGGVGRVVSVECA